MQSVVDAQTPALEVREQAVGPGQDDVRRHRTDRDCLVLDIGNVVVGWPVVGHQPGVGGHGAKHESVDLVLAEAFDHLEPGASRRAAVDFDRPLRPASCRPHCGPLARRSGRSWYGTE